METQSFIPRCLIICTSLCALTTFHTLSVNAVGTIGVNYGTKADNLPPPTRVVQLLKAQGITRVKIFDTDSNVLTALANSDISVTVCLPNKNLAEAASSQSFTDTWVGSNILPHYPSTRIESVAVGNEVFDDPDRTVTNSLVRAMQNVHLSLKAKGLDSSIKVSSPVAISALQNSYPPSAGSFKPALADPVVRPMLQFLQETGSYLMVNAYPFLAYKSDPVNIPLGYALSAKDTPGNTDSGSGLVYHGLLDAMIDAVYSALGKLGFNSLRVVVTETGWPSMGDPSETGASVANAAAYNGNLIRKVLNGPGTPLKPDSPLDVYIFALFNEDLKPGASSEKNYGLFYPNMQPVYDVPLSPSVSVLALGSSGGVSWCRADATVDDAKLQAALDWACGSGVADCGPIQPGGSCFEPNTLLAHASYAMNSYYQNKGRAPGTCDFGGAGLIFPQPPDFGGCPFPSGP